MTRICERELRESSRTHSRFNGAGRVEIGCKGGQWRPEWRIRVIRVRRFASFASSRLGTFLWDGGEWSVPGLPPEPARL